MNMINSSNFWTNQTHSYNLQAKKKKNQKTKKPLFLLLLLTKHTLQTAFIKHSTDVDEGKSAVVSPGDVRRWWRWFEPGWGRGPSGWRTVTSTGGCWRRKTTETTRSTIQSQGHPNKQNLISVNQIWYWYFKTNLFQFEPWFIFKFCFHI